MMSKLSPCWSEAALKLSVDARGEKLGNWRVEQLQLFLQKGFPNRKDENWKYTSVASLLAEEFTGHSAPNSINLSNYEIAESYRITFINGFFSPQHSSLQDLSEYVILNHFAAATEIAQNNTLSELSVFHWLNGALCGEGLFLSLPENIKLTKPLHLLYVTAGENEQNSIQHPRHALRLGKNSCATLIEEYVGLNAGCYFNNIVTVISVDDHAQLNYCKLQQENIRAFHIANTLMELGRDSQVRSFHLAFGSKLNREDVHFSLHQPGANCELSGFYFPQAGQHIDFHTRIDHQQAHTQSRQYFKGMIADEGKAVFNGKIIVRPHAQHVSATQANPNLLLGKLAEVNTKPELAVCADNVKCSHSATVGNLNQDALFYLRSRGISEKNARKLLMQGFAKEILDRISDFAGFHYIQKRFEERLYV